MYQNHLSLLALLVGTAPLGILGLTTPPSVDRQRGHVRLAAFQGFDLGSLFGSVGAFTKVDQATAQERELVKGELLELLQNGKKVERSVVEEKIAALAPLSPIQETAASPLLQKEWNLLWTTEKEINFFLDFGLSNAVSQTVNGKELGNAIAFVRGGGLYVEGTLSIPNANGQRTEFKFDTATLDLTKKWGSYNFPPVGEGWFDTVYLDDSLRIDTNSRDDILICTPSAD